MYNVAIIFLGDIMCIPRSSLIHFACIGVAPPRLFTPQDLTVEGEQLQKQAKWIKLDLAYTLQKEKISHTYINFVKCWLLSVPVDFTNYPSFHL